MARIGGDIGRQARGKSLEERAKKLRKALGLPDTRSSVRPTLPKGNEPGADRWTRLQARSVRGEPAYAPGLASTALEALARRREDQIAGREARRAAKTAARTAQRGGDEAVMDLPDPDRAEATRFPEIAPERPGQIDASATFTADEDTPEPEAAKPRRRGWLFRRRRGR
jgi:hypothetical protein